MRTFRTSIATAVGTSLVAACGLILAPIASAQDTDSALEEIVVTAQKRSQTLAEVPMSITVLSGETLERLQADNFQDLVAVIPGFSINSNRRGVSRITLRGINTDGVASTVGVYVNDVPFGSSSGLANAAILSGDFDTFDLARVEVLRGPQGTLYGASSLGGVMKYVTNKPNTEAFEARARATLESVADGGTGYSVTGLVNIPMSDTFALRASGFYRYDDGYIDSIGNNPIPSLTDPGINVIEGTRVEEDINTADVFGGRLSALFTPSDNLSIDFTALFQNIDTGSSDLVDADATTLQPISDNVRSRYHDDYTDISYSLYSATVDWQLGGMTLQSVTSYSEFEQDFVTDAAANTALTGGLPLAPVVTLFFGDAATRPLSAILQQLTSTEKFAQEFRLVSDESDTFEWLVGLYYTQEDSGFFPQQLLAVEAGTDTIAADLPPLFIAVLPSDYEESALFANATWHISPKFDLSFGARASQNDQSITQTAEGPLIGGSLTFPEATSSESPFTYSFSPRYQLTDNTSVFARVATGYRPGGPNVIPPGAPPGTPGSYDSDTLTSYEVGLKSTAAEGRLSFDLTAYFLDWEDIQLLAVVNGIGINANGGTAESKGFEFAASWQASDNLTLGVTGAYTDAYLTQDTDPVVGGLDGNPLPFVPEWSYGLDADYAWNVMGDATAYVGGNLSFVDDRPTGFSNLAPDGSIRTAESYSLMNLRAGIEFDAWSIEVYGRNVTDEEGVNDIVAEGTLPNGTVGLGLIRPATYGVAVGVRF